MGRGESGWGFGYHWVERVGGRGWARLNCFAYTHLEYLGAGTGYRFLFFLFFLTTCSC